MLLHNWKEILRNFRSYEVLIVWGRIRTVTQNNKPLIESYRRASVEFPDVTVNQGQNLYTETRTHIRTAWKNLQTCYMHIARGNVNIC